MKYRVYYYKQVPSLSDCSNSTFEFILGETHVFLKEVEADNEETAFRMMQGRNWSPNGEARPLLESKGLQHTSMSVGDVLINEDWEALVCAERGWVEPSNPQKWAVKIIYSSHGGNIITLPYKTYQHDNSREVRWASEIHINIFDTWQEAESFYKQEKQGEQ